MGIIRTETINKSIYSDINPDNPFDKSLVENAEAVLYAYSVQIKMNDCLTLM